MTLKTPSGHEPSIPNFGPIYSFFIRSLSLSLSPSVEDQNLLPLSDLLSNSCFMSLICSQAHAPWLTTKLRRPKTLLTLSIGLKHFSPLLGVLEIHFLVFWKLFFSVPFFSFLEAYFLGVLETDFLGILEADFLGFGSQFLCSFFFFLGILEADFLGILETDFLGFGSYFFWELIFQVLEANFLGIFSEVLGFFLLIFWATDITRQRTTLDLSRFEKFLGFGLLDTMVVGFCS